MKTARLSILCFILILASVLFAGEGWGATKLEVVDYVNAYIYCHDGTNYYGVKSGLSGTKLVKGTSYDNMAEVFDFANISANLAANLAWCANGSVFVFTKDSDTSKAYLYKSVDGGVSFGSNSPTFNDNNYVLMFGDVDGSIDNQISGVDILPRGFLYDSHNGQMLVGEYNYNGSRTPGGANDQVRLMKSSDNGTTWTEAAHWNTDGSTQNVVHIHGVVQDPYTHDIYILFGEDSSGLIRWDGVSSIDNNVNPEAYTDWAGDGVYGVGNSGRHRYVDLLFTQEYIFGMSDTLAAGERGIWKIGKDLGSFVLMDNAIAPYASHAGYLGVKSSSGNLYFEELLEAGATDFQLNIYSSSDSGASFSIVGKYGTTGGPHSTRQFQQVGDYLFLSAFGAGKSDISTAVLRESGTYAETEPVILHPVYWVATTGTNNTTYPNGYRPSSPWATLTYALEGDRITYGARVIVGAGTYDDQNKILTDWDGNTREGSGTTVIEGAGMDLTLHRHKAGDDANYTIYINDNTAHLLWKDMAFDDKSATVYMFRQAKSPYSEYRNVSFGSKTYARNAGSQLAPSVVTIVANCRFSGTDNTDALVGGGNGSTLTVTGSIFDGFDDLLYINRYTGLTFSWVNNTAYNYDNRGITFGSGTTFTSLTIKNDIFSGQVAGQDIIDEGSITEADAQIDYNLYLKGTTGLANSGGSHSVTGDPKFVSAADNNFRLKPGSPAINAGVDVGLVTDYAGKPIAGLPDIGAYEFPTMAPPKMLTGNRATKCVGGSGTVYDRLIAYYNAYGCTSGTINDREDCFLDTEGFTAGNLMDRWRSYYDVKSYELGDYIRTICGD